MVSKGKGWETGETATKKNGLMDQSGLCLAELMIGMVAALVVLAACFDILAMSQKSVGTNSRRIAQQQDLRLGLEVLEQELRLATTDSLIAIGRDTIEFLANIHARSTALTALVVPGQSSLPVIDGRGWERGKLVKLCKGGVCETRRLARDGQRTQLTLESPVGTNYPAGSSVEMQNHVSYYTRTGEAVRLMRMVDGGAGVLIADLKAVRFSYRDRRGRETNDPLRVTCVLVEIEPAFSRFREHREVAFRS
ncbi:MAG: hypothetical protein NZM29_00760 [Nitrospira sp.]|nr:hypothetical protein [Nitrospira sp.]